MSANPGANVVRHTIDATKQIEDGTETLVHESNGSIRMGVAIRFTLVDAGDAINIRIGMRVPGSSSVSGEDDNFDDHFHFTTTIGGLTSGASNKFAIGTDQHVISVGPWWATPAECLVKYIWMTNDSDASSIIAIHSWTLPGGGY